jgi:winged helix DNA-binding protein
MTARDIARQRLAGQYLSRPTLPDARAVVATLGAVQAQDYAGAKWAVGLRAKGLTDADVDRAVNEGAIVRTHVLRPTWHFVAAEDIRWMLALTAPRVKAAMAYYDRQHGLDEAVFRSSAKALTKAMEGGTHLTRTQLLDVFKRAKIDASAPQRLGHLMMRAELDALVCNGARRGKQATYALLDERVPTAKELRRDEALFELTRRYFATRSPATLRDFAWWSGLTVADAKRGVEMLGTEIGKTNIGERTFWVSTTAPLAAAARPNAYLIPNYDEFYIGYTDRSAIFDALRKIGKQSNIPSFSQHVLVVDGQVVGGWKRTMTPRGVSVELTTAMRLSEPARRAVKAAAKRFEQFLGQPVVVK